MVDLFEVVWVLVRFYGVHNSRLYHYRCRFHEEDGGTGTGGTSTRLCVELVWPIRGMSERNYSAGLREQMIVIYNIYLSIYLSIQIISLLNYTCLLSIL